MPRHRAQGPFRRSVLIGVGALCLVGLGWRAASGAMMTRDISEDSEIQLVEKNPLGSYRQYSIRMSMKNGTSMLSTNKDGRAKTQHISGTECMAMWRDIIAAGVEDLPDRPTGPAFPDQSEFTVTVRVKGTSHTFSAYGVDSLPDTRYRDVVRKILAVADEYAAEADGHHK
jgi:hypothetical protein